MKKVNCILLVDDNKSDNFIHEINIKKTGVCNHIRMAFDGEQAIDYIKKSDDSTASAHFLKPDIIYLDINMPKMNGFDFLDEYKHFDVKLKARVVIIMLSTSLNPADNAKALTYEEVKEFQNKPLTVEMIRKTVEKYFS